MAQRLVGDGEQVLEVPAKLAARVRVLPVGHGRKRDPDDAVSVAVAARNAPARRRVGVEDQATVLHLVTSGARTWSRPAPRPSTGCTGCCWTWFPGGARRNLTARRATALLAAVTPAGAPAVTGWQLATELVADVR